MDNLEKQFPHCTPSLISTEDTDDRNSLLFHVRGRPSSQNRFFSEPRIEATGLLQEGEKGNRRELQVSSSEEQILRRIRQTKHRNVLRPHRQTVHRDHTEKRPFLAKFIR